MTSLKTMNPDGVAAPIGAYSHVAVTRADTDLLFISGQVGMAPDGTLPASLEEQYAQALRNIVAILAGLGRSPADIAKLTTFLVREPASPLPPIRRSILGDIAPATTMVFVPKLVNPDFLVEIEAVAVGSEPTADASGQRA